jgi:uncharacterized protein YyaL (SSP411 family)
MRSSLSVSAVAVGVLTTFVALGVGATGKVVPETDSTSVEFRFYSAALREAKAARRPVLLVFTNPHCGPCKALEHGILSNPTGIRVINAAYVPVKFVLKIGDRDTVPETRESRRAANHFGVGGVPRLVVLSPQGRKVASFGWTTRDEVLLTLRLRSAPPP